MYMGPIVAAPAPVSSAPVSSLPARPAAPRALRLAAGVPTLLLSVLVMLPWLAANALVSALVLGVLALGRGPRALFAMIDYAGRVALGR